MSDVKALGGKSGNELNCWHTFCNIGLRERCGEVPDDAYLR